MPASQKGEWCMKRATTTPSSCVDEYCSKKESIAELAGSGEDEANAEVCQIGAEGLRAVTFERVKEATDVDEELLELRDAILKGEEVDKERLGQYNRYMEDLTVLDGVIFNGNRIVIPRSLRQEVLVCHV